MTTIERFAFENCTGLTALSIGSGIKNIGEKAFAKENELADVYCFAEDVPQVENNTFDNSHIEYATLHVPEKSIEKYRQSTPWSGFKNIVTIDKVGGETKQCAKPIITYENGKLNITCETQGATCYYSTTAATIDARGYAPINEASDLSSSVQVTITAFAMAEGYAISEVVSKQVSLLVGTAITETVTEYVEKWDTTYVNVEIHDTTYVNIEVHDTTFVDVPYEVYDTTYVNVEVHDTTFVDVPYEVLVHDTTYVNVEVHDTTFVDVPYEVLVHDTTYVNVEVYDTTFVDVPFEVLVVDTISVPTEQEIPAPTIVVDNGTVEIISGLEDAVIYYTLDGTMPEVNDDNRYTGPFSVTGDCTINAIAVLTSDAAAKEVVDGTWRPSQAATLRYFRASGIETDTPTSGVNIVVTQTADGKQKITKRIIK